MALSRSALLGYVPPYRFHEYGCDSSLHLMEGMSVSSLRMMTYPALHNFAWSVWFIFFISPRFLF